MYRNLICSSCHAEQVHAPFTASILDIKVSVGDAVSAGQTLMVLEAMKMEVPVVCPVDGKVVAIPVKVAQLKDVGAILLAIVEADQ
jgi:biotin carboxyl carrier protein